MKEYINIIFKKSNFNREICKTKQAFSYKKKKEKSPSISNEYVLVLDIVTTTCGIVTPFPVTFAKSSSAWHIMFHTHMRILYINITS